MRVLLSGCVITFSLAGQGRFETLQHALALSDSQVSELERLSPAGARARSDWREATRLRNLVLDDSQRTKLAAVRKVLVGDAAKLEALFGLINQKDWEPRFGGTCLFMLSQDYAAYMGGDVPLSRAQADQFSAIKFDAWQEIRAKRKQRDALLDSGASKDSPEVVKLQSAMDKLEARTREPLSRDVVMSILDATQKAKLAEFEIELQAASEAIELGLIERSGEVLCH